MSAAGDPRKPATVPPSALPDAMAGSTDPIDVVTVPDFSGAAASRFELRTLLFLGAWMRHQGASRAWPLHIACIGDPPASVRRLAAAAGASLTVHAPMPPPLPDTSNKLRGFEIAPRARRLLLLDTDVLVLRDLAPLARHVGDAIGLGPARFHVLSPEMWRAVFACVGLPPPPEARPPYFNSGVLLVRWDLGLETVWAHHLHRILAAFDGHPVTGTPKWYRHAEQHALATAVAALRRQGTPLAWLPPACAARPYMLLEGRLSWADLALFHYVKVFKREEETADGLERLLYGSRLPALRRWLAGTLGLRGIRSPLFVRVPAERLRAYGPFYDEVDRIWRDVRRVTARSRRSPSTRGESPRLRDRASDGSRT